MNFNAGGRSLILSQISFIFHILLRLTGSRSSLADREEKNMKNKSPEEERVELIAIGYG